MKRVPLWLSPWALAAPLALTASTIHAHPDEQPTRTVVERFHEDPAARRDDGDDPRHRRFEVRGAAADFHYSHHGHHHNGVHFDGDEDGSLAMTVDANAPTARYATSLGAGGFTAKDDFVFGAVITIRPEMLHADPDGFGEIAFGLFDGHSTGDDRTGDLNNFASDSFDTVELAYFPNVSALFGGPFLCPTILGEKIANDAFANIAFGCTELELTPGTPYFVQLAYSASKKTLGAKVWRLDARADPVAVGAVTTDASRITGFHVDRFGLSAYRDGFSSLSPSGESLFAIAEFDLLLVGPSASDHEIREALHHLELPGIK